MKRMMNLLLGLMVVLTMFGARPVFAADEPPIDLSIDRNGNQISDVVEAEVATLQGLPADQQSDEIKNFVSKLALSEETLALQDRALQLGKSLSTAKPEEAQAIVDELAKISAQLDEDPVIKKVTSDLLTLTGIGRKDSADPSLSADFASLRKGDILGRYSSYGFIFPWAMTYEHLGNYNGNSYVYESNPDGVTLRPLTQWQTKGQFVGLARNNRLSSSTVATGVDWAKAKWGTNGRTPYNYNFPDKWTDASLYCSQLTWKIHYHYGYNLDSNDSRYRLWVAARFSWLAVWYITDPAVAPDEVMLSPYVNVYSKGQN